MAATLVLDTNAWLDLLVFDDPALRGVDVFVRATQLAIAIDDRARAELERVLRYTELGLDASTQRALLDDAQRLSMRIDTPRLTLPRCRDPDDQIFLEIAVASRARWLVTRDAELLRMARRMSRDHGLAILAPAAWREVFDDQMSKR